MDNTLREFLGNSKEGERVFVEGLENDKKKVCRLNETNQLSCVELGGLETQLFSTLQSLGYICTLSADPNRPPSFECKKFMD
ncbi:fungal protein [Schizosaccharomyces cryophilus OY26]|uniref:Fungal protein n=1 Tax=Schizosaccharomyces cryophilus (strain OY26 / ATCC MYA-4695 / CBS 11777 / NBRC 106824 / NRRL Y48691) TaxID=653667 RepID=S9X123_SCHCR|nr:uncharacterized protein SPOG_05156 [Schizosaccharomyces cryophilus OY26]EPY50762.1 fungal protein [Schizosaccharomyces cryophilus OY26]